MLQRVNRSIDRQNMSDTEQPDAGVAAPVQVIITATRNLKSQLFIPGDDPDSQRKSVE